MTTQEGRAQLLICRHEITLGAERLRATPLPSAEDVHLFAEAILEYFALEAVIEAEEAANRQPS